MRMIKRGFIITCGSTGEANSGHILRSGQEQVHWVLTTKPLYEHGINVSIRLYNSRSNVVCT